jgi:hypothetical protein
VTTSPTDQTPIARRPRAISRHSKAFAVVGTMLALGGIVTGTAVATAAGPRHDAIEQVRDATRMFHRVGAVQRAGYAKFTDVNGVTCIDGPRGQGNMGIHYVNGALVGDGKIDAEHPEAVLYKHASSGLQITAVEYIVLASDWQGAQPPELFGHPFMFMTSPNRYGLPDFYALHAWVWQDNPHGRFEPWNPDVHCPKTAA